MVETIYADFLEASQPGLEFENAVVTNVRILCHWIVEHTNKNLRISCDWFGYCSKLDHS